MGALDIINERKQIILRAVVNDYVQTAEPVGSHTLTTRYTLGVKAATVRSELAELSDMGYLCQPHTSSGRIPSDMGYRFYVDRLMDQTTQHGSAPKFTVERSEVDLIIEQTCRMLSRIARYTSLATHPDLEDAVVSLVSVAKVGPKKMLAVIALENGRVLHEFVDTREPIRNSFMQRMNGVLTSLFVGKSPQALAQYQSASTGLNDPAVESVVSKICDLIIQTAAKERDADVHFEGASYIMQEPEFQDAKRLEAVLSLLETKKPIRRLLSTNYLSPGVTVIIGSENPLDEMRDCSFVATGYRIRNRAAGSIGVMGPTRMDYGRAVSAVRFMARNLGDILTELSVC